MAEPYSHPGSAQVYDAVYAEHHPYAGGAATVLELVRKAGDGRDPKSMSLLDVGCGTGRHLELLAGEFGSVAGLDLSEVQLAAAAERLGPGIPLYHGDMLALGSVLGARPGAGRPASFDVMLCLHSSIAYLAGAEELTTAIGEMARLLAPGGTLIIEPWLRPDAYRSFGVITYFIDRPDLKVARMCSRTGRATCPCWTCTTWWPDPTGSSTTWRSIDSACSPKRSSSGRSAPQAWRRALIPTESIRSAAASGSPASRADHPAAAPPPEP